MKKLLGIVLSAAMLLSMAACGSTAASSAASSAAADSTADAATATDAAASDLKVGVITIGDETEGYTAAHINGIKAAAQKLGMSDSQIVWKYKVPVLCCPQLCCSAWPPAAALLHPALHPAQQQILPLTLPLLPMQLPAT